MKKSQLALFEEASVEQHTDFDTVLANLRKFEWHDRHTAETPLGVAPAADGTGGAVPMLVNEFWTSKQRAAHSLHEISYRACFKPQLPRFFIERFTSEGDRVYDPFSGRGTTALEAAILGRLPVACDVNPLSRILLEPRLAPPHLRELTEALKKIDWARSTELPDDLLAFYHPDTLREICSLREYLLDRSQHGRLTDTDRWIRMVAVNRLTGHSRGFFSVYTLPPNQAVSVDAQRKINAQRNQTPDRRSVPDTIIGKSRSLLADLDEVRREALRRVSRQARLLTAHAASTPDIPSDSIDLVVTSPPFLDVVDYAGDNWLRCWFCGIDPGSVSITIAKRLEHWRDAMTSVFHELFRVTRPGGCVAFEVGEVRGGKVRLEETVIPAATIAGFEPRFVLVNSQQFTKTAACWGVSNNSKGTNTNRIVALQKP